MTLPVTLERGQYRSGPSFWKSCLPEPFREPFIVGHPTRIACQCQLLGLELGDGFAPGPAIGEIGLERLACPGLAARSGPMPRSISNLHRGHGTGSAPAIGEPIRSH